jgi:U3 small nucleolar RNA-associated protein 19
LQDSQFLFPPPRDAIPEEEEEAEDSSDEDESDDNSNDGTDSDDDGDGSSNDNKEAADSKRPTKRQKTELEHKFAFQQMRMFRRQYQKAWFAVLRLPLSLGCLKKALHFLPTNVLNYGRSPLRFADFFMQAYSDHDSGVVGVLALDGLFLLITECGLEYPNFYKQLYRLVSPRVLYAKYRTRFFSLLNKCLVRNEMLPAHIVAAFLKRLCRSALSGPAPGALFVLALVSNLLRKHPECNCLIQRNVTTGDGNVGGGEMEDPFLPEQDDPVECRALQSSLWELAIFERHYYPAVATLAKSIGREEEARAPPYVIEDFASHTFTSLFEQERKKKTKTTALTFKEPVSLFTEDDVFSDFFEIGSTAT